MTNVNLIFSRFNFYKITISVITIIVGYITVSIVSDRIYYSRTKNFISSINELNEIKDKQIQIAFLENRFKKSFGNIRALYGIKLARTLCQDEKYQEERTDKDQIGWRDSPPRKTRRPKQNSDVIGILILSLIIVIFLFLLANLLGLGNIFNSQQHNSPFEFYIEEMSSKDFQNLRELSDSHPEYLKSSVLKSGDKLGSGGRVKLLVAKPSQKQSIQSVNLKYQEIDLSRKMDIVDARSIFDPHFDTYFQGKNIQDRSIPISVGENADKGFIFFMYSYNSNPNQEDLGKSGESVDSVIYIPNRIEYLTKNTSHLQRIREGLKESGRGYYE